MLRLILIFNTFLLISAEKIIIIGAGASGIAAASKLLENNVTDFLILESEQRIGGRVFSFQLGENYVDLGAEYVHGVNGNLVYNLSSEFLKIIEESENSAFYFKGHKRENNLLANYFSILVEIEKSSKKLESIGDEFLLRFNETVLKKYEKNYDMLDYAKCFLKTSEFFMDSLEGSFDWFDISTSTEYVYYEGCETVSWQGYGYKKIFEILLKNRTIDEKILFNTTVQKLILGENSVKIKTDNNVEFNADFVIFTPSVGVLKNKYDTLFEPKLDEERIKIIENMGYDGVMKIIFEFNDTWWNGNENYVFVWNDEDINELKETITYGPIKNDDHWLTWFQSLNSAPNNPKVMIGWIVGPFVKEIEKLSTEQLKNAAYYAMKKFLGRDFDVKQPIKIISSKWCSNTNFYGTYSYDSVKLQRLNISSPRKILSKSILDRNEVPRIFFAGEATNVKRYSTVDGAIETGFRESENLLKVLKKIYNKSVQ